ncbi:hypothetical protein HC766_03620 [Candidatus Gracilibacteria bacterium]|nr:hypothetical protein [Candidatus Gracilibacteria bacterium]
MELTKHQKETLENLIIAVYGFVNISYKTRRVYNYSGNGDLGHKISSSNFDRVGIEELDQNSIYDTK